MGNIINKILQLIPWFQKTENESENNEPTFTRKREVVIRADRKSSNDRQKERKPTTRFPKYEEDMKETAAPINCKHNHNNNLKQKSSIRKIRNKNVLDDSEAPFKRVIKRKTKNKEPSDLSENDNVFRKKTRENGIDSKKSVFKIKCANKPKLSNKCKVKKEQKSKRKKETVAEKGIHINIVFPNPLLVLDPSTKKLHTLDEFKPVKEKEEESAFRVPRSCGSSSWPDDVDLIKTVESENKNYVIETPKTYEENNVVR